MRGARIAGDPRRGVLEWTNLEIDVDQLRRRVPPPVDPRALEIATSLARLARAKPPAPPTQDVRAVAERLTRVMVAEAEAAGVRPTKAAFIADLRGRSEAETGVPLSARAAIRAWDNRAPSAWRKARRAAKSRRPPA